MQAARTGNLTETGNVPSQGWCSGVKNFYNEGRFTLLSYKKIINGKENGYLLTRSIDNDPTVYKYAVTAHWSARNYQYWTPASETPSLVKKSFAYGADVSSWLLSKVTMLTSGTVGIVTATLNTCLENIDPKRTWIRGALKIVLTLVALANMAVSVLFGAVRLLAATATGIVAAVVSSPFIALYNGVSWCRTRGQGDDEDFQEEQEHRIETGENARDVQHEGDVLDENRSKEGQPASKPWPWTRAWNWASSLRSGSN